MSSDSTTSERRRRGIRDLGTKKVTSPHSLLRSRACGAEAGPAEIARAGLDTALDSRKLIGQAQGLLMERYGLDEARAFEVLRRYSEDHNIKLRPIAAHLIATRDLPSSEEITNSADHTGTPAE